MVCVIGNCIDIELVVCVGMLFDIVVDDLLICYCIDMYMLGYLQVFELWNVNNLEDSLCYVVCVFVLLGVDELIGLVVVYQMLFFLLLYENLQFLFVLFGYYVDGVCYFIVSFEIFDFVFDVLYEFVFDFGWLVCLYCDIGIDLLVVVFIFYQDEVSDVLFESVVCSCCVLDVVWQVSGKNCCVIIMLMLLLGVGVVLVYLVCIEDSLCVQFGVDFEGGYISVQMLYVIGEYLGEVLQCFFLCCYFDVQGYIGMWGDYV